MNGVIRLTDLAVIPAFIGDMRVLNRLTQRDLAVESGHRQGQVSSWELAKVTPSIQALIDVAGALGYDLALVPQEEPPCPTCTGPLRETVGMVCQTCGTDYGTQEDS